MANFIGINALTHIAEQYESQIIMGASYFRPSEFQRLGINVISGVQFKNIKTVMARKGGTTRRKVVGSPVENKIGFLKERTLTAKLTWNRYKDNRDNYVETPYQVEGSAEFSYPMSEAAFLAITANYGEDLYNNLWFGAIANESVSGKEALSLFDGFHTCIAQDIEDGVISTTVGNLVASGEVGDFDAPSTTTDFAAWTHFEAFWAKWSPALKTQPDVLVYCSIEAGAAIAAAYANKWHGNQGVNYLGDGNFKVMEYPKVTFCPDDNYGSGDRLIATVKGNLEYGVNSEDSRTKIVVKEGSDDDTEDIIFQVQSIQGARVLNPFASQFCMTNHNIAPVIIAGDYQKSTYDVTPNDAAKGTVTVNGAAPVAGKEYPEGTILTLNATAKSGYVFKNWSNGATTAEITVVTPGVAAAITAIFAAQ